MASNQEIFDACQKVYEVFGQYAVQGLVNDRQRVGELLNVEWQVCEPCNDDDNESWQPILDNTCLVCGSVI